MEDRRLIINYYKNSDSGIHIQKIGHSADAELREVLAAVKGLEIDLTEPLGMDSAQVAAGGVLTDGHSCILPATVAVT